MCCVWIVSFFVCSLVRFCSMNCFLNFQFFSVCSLVNIEPRIHAGHFFFISEFRVLTRTILLCHVDRWKLICGFVHLYCCLHTCVDKLLFALSGSFYLLRVWRLELLPSPRFDTIVLNTCMFGGSICLPVILLIAIVVISELFEFHGSAVFFWVFFWVFFSECLLWFRMLFNLIVLFAIDMCVLVSNWMWMTRTHDWGCSKLYWDALAAVRPRDACAMHMVQAY